MTMMRDLNAAAVMGYLERYGAIRPVASSGVRHELSMGQAVRGGQEVLDRVPAELVGDAA